MSDPLLDDLDSSQRAAVTNPAVPLAIIAPAGSGKTRVLTRRIAFRVREDLAVGRHVLAVTFTRKAAGELLHRIDALGVEGPITAGTFHAVALAQLRRRAAEHNREAPQILDRKARLLGPIVGGRGNAGVVAVGDIAAEIEWAKARQVAPERYELAVRAVGRRVPRPAADIATMFRRYEDEKRKRHLLDFDDVLGECIRALEHDEEFRAGQRWRFRHLFVDEFQDATPLQLRLLHGWLGTNTDLTVVGDPAQAIYGFAGADAAPLLEFDRAFTGGVTVSLAYNYRSTPSIVRAAEAALGRVATGARRAPEAVRLEGDVPDVRAYDDDALEAAEVANACWHAHTRGIAWHDIAILFRTNAQSSHFETALAQRGVPVRTEGTARFVARPAVRVALDRLREIEREHPQRAFGDHLADIAADDKIFNTDDLSTHRDAVVDLGRQFVALDGGAARTAAFVAWLDTATRSAGGGEPGVELATFHRAKGLEWKLVFVTGLEAGLVPISWATTDDHRDEERRLLHVALSRAVDELHCSWARVRASGGRRVAREPSPWLADIEHTTQAERVAPRGAREHLVDLRETLAAISPPAPPPKRARRLRR